MALQFPHIDPVALSIGPLDIRWYALAYLAGILGGWAYGLYLGRIDPNQRPTKLDIDDFIPWAVLGVIGGGRIGYVLFYQPSMYLHDPLSAFMLWQGGMSFHGGALGVIIALIAYAKTKSIPLLRLTDIACASVPLGLLFGRLANFINGELYGRVTDASVGMVFPHAGDLPRHPSQLYEAFFEGLVLFVVLASLYHTKAVRHRPGIVTGVFLAGYGVARFCIEYYREPDYYLGLFWDALSMGQILCLPMITLGLGVIAYAARKGRVLTHDDTAR